MKPIPCRSAIAAPVTAAFCILLVSCHKRGLAPGEAAIVCAFEESAPIFKSPEGVAVDQQNNLFVSLRTLQGSAITKNEIVRIAPSGDRSTLVDLGPVQQPGSGALGLTVDERGKLYVVFASADERKGVYQVTPDGQSERLPGSARIHFPNSLCLDDRGNLYVTDCYPATPKAPGVVWRWMPGNECAIWATDELLAPDPVANPLGPPPPAKPFAAPGANGIVFAPPGSLYVANTEKCLIVRIPILPDGNAGEVEMVAGAYPPVGPPGLLFAPDGLAIDSEGFLYAAIPPAGFTGRDFPLSPVIRIDPANGEINPVVTPLTESSPLFDFPTSLAIDIRSPEGEIVFIANMTGRTLGMGEGSGPKITRVRIGR